jgi:hypothetical protein
VPGHHVQVDAASPKFKEKHGFTHPPGCLERERKLFVPFLEKPEDIQGTAV